MQQYLFIYEICGVSRIPSNPREEIAKITALVSKHKKGEMIPIDTNIREPKIIRVQLYNGDEFIEEIVGQIKPASFEPGED